VRNRIVACAALAICVANITNTAENVFVTNLLLGRTGAHLGCYLKAKAVAAYLDVPFVLTPFPYSKEFKLHTADPLWAKRHEGKKIVIRTKKQLEKIKSDLDKLPTKQVTYQVHGCLRINNGQLLSKEEKDRLLTPIKEIDGPHPPVGHASVAVHVRTGGGFDSKHDIATQPERFPGINYYAKQIQHLADTHPDKKLWCFIFTDHPTPETIVDTLAKLINAPNISMECRKKNRHNINIIEDIILMSRCRYLIKAKSSYSGMAAIIGKHEAVLDLKSGAFLNEPWRPGK